MNVEAASRSRTMPCRSPGGAEVEPTASYTDRSFGQGACGTAPSGWRAILVVRRGAAWCGGRSRGSCLHVVGAASVRRCDHDSGQVQVQGRGQVQVQVQVQGEAVASNVVLDFSRREGEVLTRRDPAEIPLRILCIASPAKKIDASK